MIRRFRLPRRRAISRHPRRALFYKLAVILLILCAITFALDRALRPTIQTVIHYHVKTAATKIINDAVYQQLETLNLSYQDLSTISKDDQGAITSIETNTITINKIKTSIMKTITDRAFSLEDGAIKIPLGTLTNIHLFSAMGPKITIRAIPQGVAKIQFISAFESAGVNQTQHRLSMNISMEMAAVIPGFTTHVEIPSEFLLAETIIVGAVPEYYTQIISSDEQLLEKIDAYDRPSPQ